MNFSSLSPQLTFIELLPRTREFAVLSHLIPTITQEAITVVVLKTRKLRHRKFKLTKGKI